MAYKISRWLESLTYLGFVIFGSYIGIGIWGLITGMILWPLAILGILLGLGGFVTDVAKVRQMRRSQQVSDWLEDLNLLGPPTFGYFLGVGIWGMITGYMWLPFSLFIIIVSGGGLIADTTKLKQMYWESIKKKFFKNGR